jgi:hypothetical protein
MMQVICNAPQGLRIGLSNPPHGYPDMLVLSHGLNTVDAAMSGVFAARHQDATLGGLLTILASPIAAAPLPPDPIPPIPPKPPKPKGFLECLKSNFWQS